MSIVLITQSVRICTERGERLDALDQRLSTFVQYCGYIPVPIPNNLSPTVNGQNLTNSKLKVWLDKIAPSGVILSGGPDLGLYIDRDLTEKTVLAYAQRERIPTLGICRGMQLMAIKGKSPLHETSGHVRCKHSVTGGINRKVNSFHKFSINFCPENFKILARSLDGEIEAIQHKSLPMEGWMWHPERACSFSAQDVRRLKNLFDYES